MKPSRGLGRTDLQGKDGNVAGPSNANIAGFFILVSCVDFFLKLIARRLDVYVRRRFLILPSLSSINIMPHQPKSINRGVINTPRNYDEVYIESALTKLLIC